MKVMLMNGSPHQNGCCHTALEEISHVLEKNGVESEWIWVGNKPIVGCIGCASCMKTGKCIFNEDKVNEAVERFKSCDGLIVASPVHYASASGAVTSFMDRFFYSGDKADMKLKLGASVVSCRRGGASAAFDQLNKYFTISEMPIVSSSYWNQVHGNTPEEVKQDLEGMRTMRVLANNMAYLLKAIKLAKENGLTCPEEEPKVRTNFIR
jgi:multimeric flavodoxin WrbA